MLAEGSADLRLRDDDLREPRKGISSPLVGRFASFSFDCVSFGTCGSTLLSLVPVALRGFRELELELDRDGVRSICGVGVCR